MTSLVTKKAPDFKATAVMEDGSFKEVSLSDYKGKNVGNPLYAGTCQKAFFQIVKIGRHIPTVRFFNIFPDLLDPIILR